MSPKIVATLLLVCLLGTFGCIDRITKNKDQQILPQYSQKIRDANTSIQIAKQKASDASDAIRSGQYSEARTRLSEAKAYLITARGNYEEACTLTRQSSSLPCPDSSIIDRCWLPGIEIVNKVAYLSEDIKSKCWAFGCPEEVKSSCLDLLSTTSKFDVQCDTNTSKTIKETCEKIT